MLMKDPKKSLALLVAKKMSSPDMENAPENENGDEQDDSIGLKSAAEEILKAVKSDDPSALIEALKSFYEMCQSDEEPSEQPEGPSEQP